MTSLTSFFRAFASAVRTAAAVDNGRAPNPADLRRLGIDPAAFLTLGHG